MFRLPGKTHQPQDSAVSEHCNKNQTFPTESGEVRFFFSGCWEKQLWDHRAGDISPTQRNTLLLPVTTAMPAGHSHGLTPLRDTTAALSSRKGNCRAFCCLKNLTHSCASRTTELPGSKQQRLHSTTRRLRTPPARRSLSKSWFSRS